MATTIGRVDFLVDADGRILEARLRQIGQRAGDRAGRSFSQSLERSINQGSTGALGRIAQRFDRVAQSVRGSTAALDNNRRSWGSLPHGFRQAVFWTGLIIASLTELSVLSAAAGAGLFTLGGAAAALVAGLGITAVAFINFLGDVEKLPEALKGPRAAFDGMIEQFKTLGDAIAVATFSGTEGAWESFGRTIQALTPAFESVGRVINSLIGDLAAELAPGTKAFEDLFGFIENSGKLFGQITRAVGRFGRTLLSAFNNPRFQKSMEQAVGYIELLIDRFEDFVNSPGFDEWLDNADRVFGAFGKLLDTTGRLLNDLVTPASVQQLVDFIDNIDRFLSTGGAGILEFAQGLDIFGILAQLLADVGEALEPIREPMAEFAEALSDIVSIAIDQWAKNLEGVAEALAPVVQGFADFLADVPEDAVRAVADAIGVLIAAILGAKTIGVVAGSISAVAGALGGLASTGKVSNMLKSATAIAGISAAIDGLGRAAGENQEPIQRLGGVLETTLGGALLGFSVGGPIGAAIGALIGYVASLSAALATDLDGIVATFVNWFYTLIGLSDEQIALFEQSIYRIFPENLFDGAQWEAVSSDWKVFVWDPLIAGFANTHRDIATGVDEFWAGLHATTITSAATVQASFATFWTGLTTGWNTFWAGIGEAHTSGWSGIVNGWNGFWSQVGVVVSIGWTRVSLAFSNLWTGITTNWSNFWNGLVAIVSGAVSSIIDWVGRIVGPIRDALNWVGRLGSGGANSGNNGGALRRAASGMIVNGPRILAGESGREAIVPLNRPLNLVDPSVRAISAFAQGDFSGLSMGGGGRQVTVAPGAIVVEGTRDADAVAVGVLNRLVERLA